MTNDWRPLRRPTALVPEPDHPGCDYCDRWHKSVTKHGGPGLLRLSSSEPKSEAEDSLASDSKLR